MCHHIIPKLYQQTDRIKLSNKQLIDGINYYLEQIKSYRQEQVNMLL